MSTWLDDAGCRAVRRDMDRQVAILEREGRTPVALVMGLAEEWAVRAHSRIVAGVMEDALYLGAHRFEIRRAPRPMLLVLPADFRGYAQGACRGGR